VKQLFTILDKLEGKELYITATVCYFVVAFIFLIGLYKVVSLLEQILKILKGG
jgi:hypothetical protein